MIVKFSPAPVIMRCVVFLEKSESHIHATINLNNLSGHVA